MKHFTKEEKVLLEAALGLLYWQEYNRLTQATHLADRARIEQNIADIDALRAKIGEEDHGRVRDSIRDPE